jgi:transcriptional regulator with XRE-family HTH domain
MASKTNPSSRQPPWDQGNDSEAVSFGTWLRRERELRQVSLPEIAEETKISTRYLEALEEDRFDVVPGAVFTRGFLRQYAEYVGLDPDEVVNSYLAAREEPGSAGGEPEAVTPRRPKSRTGFFLIVLLVAVLLGVAALAFFVERSAQEDRVDEALPPISAPTAPPQAVELSQPEVVVRDDGEEIAAPAVTVGLVAALDFQGECWVEAIADGRRVVSELRVAGESLQLQAEESLRLTLGDPEAVRLEVNGEAYPLDAYPPGRVAEVALEAPPVPPADSVAPLVDDAQLGGAAVSPSTP